MGYSADKSPLIGHLAGPIRRLKPLGAQRQEKCGPNHLTREGLHATTPRFMAAFNAANSLLRLGQYQQAIDSYSHAAEREPHNPAPWHSAGVAHVRMGDLPGAYRADREQVPASSTIFSTTRVDSRGLRWTPVDSTAVDKRLTPNVLDHKLRVVS